MGFIAVPPVDTLTVQTGEPPQPKAIEKAAAETCSEQSENNAYKETGLAIRKNLRSRHKLTVSNGHTAPGAFQAGVANWSLTSSLRSSSRIVASLQPCSGCLSIKLDLISWK